MGSPVTKEQIEILDSLICERLSSNPDNKINIKGIVSKRNPDLVTKLQDEATWKEDAENKIAYYLVKTPSGKILTFFSLRCGELFKPVQEVLFKLAELYLDNLSFAAICTNKS